jgi:hypothetical protein
MKKIQKRLYAKPGRASYGHSCLVNAKVMCAQLCGGVHTQVIVYNRERGQ